MGANREEGDRLVGDREIAERLSMSVSYVRGQRHRRKHGMSHFLTIEPVMVGGKSPRYWETDVDAFFAGLKAANDNNEAAVEAQAPEVDDSAWDVYIDGSCFGNPGPGGYAFVAFHNGEETEFADGEAETTNNRMELMAPIVALETLPAGSNIRFFGDSQYVILGITKWIHTWKEKGWRSASGKPVANQDLWEQLDEARQRHEVEWRWVRGHQGDPHQERADALARAEAERQRTRAN